MAGLKKSASRRTESQQKKENAFLSEFDNLFDVAHADAFTLITVQEDREFLMTQREKGRCQCMSTAIDMKLAKIEDRH